MSKMDQVVYTVFQEVGGLCGRSVGGRRDHKTGVSTEEELVVSSVEYPPTTISSGWLGPVHTHTLRTSASFQEQTVSGDRY